MSIFGRRCIPGKMTESVCYSEMDQNGWDDANVKRLTNRWMNGKRDPILDLFAKECMTNIITILYSNNCKLY